jgi:hypothetical protein
MKTLAAIIAIFAATAFAQPPVYKLRPERIAVGTVYHYVKTNTDGTQPEQISLYIATRDRIESYKFHPKGSRAGLVTAEMNWKNFVPAKLESRQVFPTGERKLFATLTLDADEKNITVSIPSAKPEPETVKVESMPFHLYNFDLASLNVTLPHLADPKKAFTVGIVDPTFKPEPLVAYKGELRVTYEKDEQRNGVETRRYRAEGNGIGGKGTIWVNKKLGHIEDMEFDVANNPDWKTFKLKLTKTEKMTADQWQSFIAAQF